MRLSKSLEGGSPQAQYGDRPERKAARIEKVLIYVIAAFMLLPLYVALPALFGYEFKLASYLGFAIIAALLFVGAVVLSCIEKEPFKDRAVGAICALLPFFSLMTAVVCLFGDHVAQIAAIMPVCVGCSIYLSIRYGRPMAVKTASLALTVVSWALTGIMLLPVGLFGSFALLFGDFGKNTVVQHIESPSGACYVEVIDSDQGALGGDTFVDVRHRGIDAFIFSIAKKPQRVYTGDWGEGEGMKIYWESDDLLVVNSVKYAVE